MKIEILEMATPEHKPFMDHVVKNESSQAAIVPKGKGTFTDHLANERTFLAWTRTGLGIFALGCAIARFGGSDNVKSLLRSPLGEKKPMVSGLILTSCGILIILYGVWRYYRINRYIDRRDVAAAARVLEPIVATLLLFMSMIAIVVIFIIL